MVDVEESRVDFDQRCTNESWATVRAEAMLDRHGHDVVVVVAKVAYTIAASGRVRIAFRPVRWADVPDGHGGVRFPGELVDDKPGTDVVLLGTLQPPRGKSVERMLAWVSVGPLRKVIAVHGARRLVPDWRGVVPGPAAPLEPTPLRWDLCFGGRDLSGEHVVEEPHNPVGRGFAVDPLTLSGHEAHRLEPVADPSTGKVPHPSHGCFAPIPPSWEPRRSLAGTHDADWAKNRAPVRPKDFHVRHNGCAVPELHASEPLEPDTPFEVGGLLPEGVWRFRLPKYDVEMASVTAGQRVEHRTHLDTVIIDADEQTVELVWRAAIRLPRKWEHLERIHVRGRGTMPEEVLESGRATTGAAIEASASGG